MKAYQLMKRKKFDKKSWTEALITSFFSKLIIFTVCCFSVAKFFTESLPLYTSCLFSMLLNRGIVDIEKSDGIYSPTFNVNEFSGLFLHPSRFLRP